MRDCITFRGKEYRVEVDMLVLDQYLRSLGTTKLADVNLSMPMDVLMLIYLSLAEGAALDGVELEVKPEDLQRMRKAEYEQMVEAFLPIFRKHVQPDVEEEEESKKKAKAETD